MKRSFLAPELLQISTMDCGVAALSCLLEGYGIHTSYERLRSACQTSVDGTSIDALEDLATELGVDVCQHLLPLDMLWDGLVGRMPAILVVQRPGLPAHFVNLWRRLGKRVHVMDPGRGRGWMTLSQLEALAPKVTHRLDEGTWREWFAESSLREVLEKRCDALLGSRGASVRGLLAAPPGAQELAAVDAALRLVARTTRIARRSERWRWQLFERALNQAGRGGLPEAFWALGGEDGALTLSGAVCLAPIEQEGAAKATQPASAPVGSARARSVLKQPDEARAGVWHGLLKLLRSDVRMVVGALTLGVTAIALASTAEVLIYRAALDAPRTFPVLWARLGAATVIGSLLFLLLGLELAVLRATNAVGRFLEVRLRLSTFALLPQVDDAFISSRATSDLAYRAHNLALGRQFPLLAVAVVRGILDLLTTLVALTLLDRANLPVAVGGILAIAGVYALSRRRLRDIDERFVAHGARLLTLFLDAVRGFRPLRLHGYHHAFRATQAAELAVWQETGELQARTMGGFDAFHALVSTALLALIFWLHCMRAGDSRAFVILAFWVLRLPGIVRSLLTQFQTYPAQRSAFARLLEIMRYGDEHAAAQPLARSQETPRGVALEWRSLTVMAGGRAVLNRIDLSLRAGEHVAVVGASGSGKSSLVGVLLGFHEVTEGALLVDGAPLLLQRLRTLRQETAWVDPGVQLWNDSFFANLEYAADGHERRDMLETLDASDLLAVLDAMDRGLDAQLGAEGRLISGGEGQRVRLGRALRRASDRLAILDEAFRGLDRKTRAALTVQARLAWKNATMLFISHDIGHALQFERVIVMEDGRVAEDGHPLELLQQKTSRFAAMLEAEKRVLGEVFHPQQWRRIYVAKGVVREGEP